MSPSWSQYLFGSPVSCPPPTAAKFYPSSVPCTSPSRVTVQAQTTRCTDLPLLQPLRHPTTASLSLELCLDESRPRTVPSIARRLRNQLKSDIWDRPRTRSYVAVDSLRALAERATIKASAADVTAKRSEFSRVSRIARQLWQHAPTLGSKESSLKGM